MRNNLKLFPIRMVSTVALGIGPSLSLTAAAFSDANWTGVGLGMNNTVRALAVSGTDVYAGGDFTWATNHGNIAVPVNRIAKWDGNNWSALDSGMIGIVRALAVSGSNVYAGGGFRTADGSPAGYIAKWNGTSWTSLGSGMNGPVAALAISGSNVFAGGWFTMAGGIAAYRIAKWDGNTWSALGSGVRISYAFPYHIPTPAVFALAVSGNDLYAGGYFDVPARGIARWDGNSWSSVGWVIDTIYALAVSGSELYAGGYTPIVSEECRACWDSCADVLPDQKAECQARCPYLCAPRPPNSAAKLRNGWSVLAAGTNGLVNAVVMPGDELYAGGSFMNIDGTAATRIARWNGSSWTALGSGINSNVYALAVSGSDLYAGGDFTTAGGKAARYVARAYLPALPELSVRRFSADVMVSWPSVDTAGFTLEQAALLTTPASWVTSTTNVTDDGTNKSVTIPTTNTAQFFRLRRP